MNIYFKPTAYYLGLDRTVIPSVEPVLETLLEPLFTGVPVYDPINPFTLLSTTGINPIGYPIINNMVLPII